MSATISIVHPSDGERRVLAGCLAHEEAIVSAYATSDALLRALAPDARGCVIAPSDLPAPGTRSLIDALRARHSALRIVVLGRDGDLATAVALVRAGAIEYLAPPLSHRRLRSVVRWALAPLPLPNAGVDAR